MQQEDKKDVWSDLERGIHKDFLACLHSNDSKKLADYLCNMSLNNVTHGIAQGEQMARQLQQDVEFRETRASLYFDRILCLAEMMGCLPLEGPEQGQFGQNIKYSVHDVVHLIKSEMGFSILPPSN